MAIGEHLAVVRLRDDVSGSSEYRRLLRVALKVKFPLNEMHPEHSIHRHQANVRIKWRRAANRLSFTNRRQLSV